MSTLPPADADLDAAQRLRQKRLATLLAWLLIVGGVLIFLALERMPLPMRVLVGLVDIFAGVTLLVLIRQKFSKL